MIPLLHEVNRRLHAVSQPGSVRPRKYTKVALLPLPNAAPVVETTANFIR
jgi:hypothetical protein